MGVTNRFSFLSWFLVWLGVFLLPGPTTSKTIQISMYHREDFGVKAIKKRDVIPAEEYATYFVHSHEIYNDFDNITSDDVNITATNTSEVNVQDFYDLHGINVTRVEGGANGTAIEWMVYNQYGPKIEFMDAIQVRNGTENDTMKIIDVDYGGKNASDEVVNGTGGVVDELEPTPEPLTIREMLAEMIKQFEENEITRVRAKERLRRRYRREIEVKKAQKKKRIKMKRKTKGPPVDKDKLHYNASKDIFMYFIIPFGLLMVCCNGYITYFCCCKDGKNCAVRCIINKIKKEMRKVLIGFYSLLDVDNMGRFNVNRLTEEEKIVAIRFMYFLDNEMIKEAERIRMGY